MYVRAPCGGQRGPSDLRKRVSDGYEPTYVCLESNLGPLEEQTVPTVEPSLQMIF